MSDELVRRLQHLGDWQAADRIEALKARVVELERLVKILMDSDPWDYRASDAVTVLDVWRKEARAALEGGKKDEAAPRP